MRSASVSALLNQVASPEPSQRVPSGEARTVPMECDGPSEGMQSLVGPGAHPPPLTEPSRTLSAPTVPSVATVKRDRREDLRSPMLFVVCGRVVSCS